MLKLAILISGRGSNLKAIIDAIERKELRARIAVVISNKAEAPGLKLAEKACIPTIIINHKDYKTREEFDAAIDKELRAKGVELVCLAGFMRIISGWFVNQWRGRMINIHPSLLPDFKGMDAQKQALEAGVKEAGCTVHLVTEEMDAGPIIMQAKVPVFEGDTVESLTARILEQEHKIYPLAIKKIINDGL